MDNTRNKQNDNLGVNKLGKNIKKSSLHQPNFNNNATRQQPQPPVYNISKNNFRNIVQQLTGSPSHEPLPRPPPQNPPKSQSMRLQRIRPPPLTPINRPPNPPPIPVSVAPPQSVRPAQFVPQLPTVTPTDSFWSHTAESPISAYMRYLQTSLLDPTPRGNPGQPSQVPQVPGPVPGSGLLPNPPNFPSPTVNAPSPSPSPTSQLLLPSPSGYLNILSPRSPYPLLSPGIKFSPTLSPNFSFSPMGHSGIQGPGPHAPPSPGVLFPLSPSGFFPISSPRQRD